MSVFKHVSMYSGVMGSIMKDIRCPGAGLAGKFELFNMDVIFYYESYIYKYICSQCGPTGDEIRAFHKTYNRSTNDGCPHLISVLMI